MDVGPGDRTPDRTRGHAAMSPPPGSTRLTPAVGPRDHVRGRLGAPMVLLEFGDYQCPFSRQVAPTVRRLQVRLGDGLLFAYRHLPLTGVHPLAQGAAEAAEAAGVAGKFWEMHDRLFDDPIALAPAELARRAEALGMDPARLVQDLQRHTYLDRVREQYVSGVRSGANGTPTFFVNGARYDGSYELVELLAALRARPAPRA